MHAEMLARRTAANLTLVRAARHHTGLRDPAIEQQRALAEAEDYLSSVSARLTAKGVAVQTGVPFGGSAASWIVEEISIRNAALVVMATHDRVGPDR